MKNTMITIDRIMETTYEDNTSWVEYTVNGRYAYEIIQGTEEDEVMSKFLNLEPKKLEDKIKLKECSELMQDIIEECRGSENEMWFVEEDEISTEEVEELEKEIMALGLEEYIITWEDGCAITVYGGAITKFIF